MKEKEANISPCKIDLCILILLLFIEGIVDVLMYAINRSKSKQIYIIFFMYYHRDFSVQRQLLYLRVSILYDRISIVDKFSLIVITTTQNSACTIGDIS